MIFGDQQNFSQCKLLAYGLYYCDKVTSCGGFSKQNKTKKILHFHCLRSSKSYLNKQTFDMKPLLLRQLALLHFTVVLSSRVSSLLSCSLSQCRCCCQCSRHCSDADEAVCDVRREETHQAFAGKLREGRNRRATSLQYFNDDTRQLWSRSHSNSRPRREESSSDNERLESLREYFFYETTQRQRRCVVIGTVNAACCLPFTKNSNSSRGFRMDSHVLNANFSNWNV